MADTLEEIEARIRLALNRLNEHGKHIEYAMIEGALALYEAYTDKVYKSKAETFEAWALAEFGLRKRTAYKWISCAKVHLALTDGGCKLLPATQKHYRKLDILPDEQQAAVWDAAVAKADSKQPTNGQLEKAVDEVLGPPVKQPEPAPAEPEPVKDELGRVVPHDLVNIFKGREELKEIAQDISKLAKEMRQLRKMPLGEYIPQSVVSEIASARKSLLWALPYAVVSNALLRTVADGEAEPAVERLAQVGWMPKELYERLPEDLR